MLRLKKERTQTMLLLLCWGEIPLELCLPYSRPHASALWDKRFFYQSRDSFISGKAQHSSSPCLLHHLDLLCPFQESPWHRLVCCQPAWSHMWPRRTDKTQMEYLSDRILLWHRQECGYITWVYCSRSMAASACLLCSTSFPGRKGGVQLSRSSWILYHKITK